MKGLSQRMAAEACGTAMLLVAVVGSGIMAERLAGGNVAPALLANAMATGGALVALILAFGPVSGAHFNPVVTLADASQGGLPGSAQTRPGAVAFAVAAYITGAYWFTSSTSFANPAVTLARAATDTFAGIRPADVPGFLAGEAIGGMAATALFRWLAPRAMVRVAPEILAPHSPPEASP